MNAVDARLLAADLLYREALHLDRQEWDQWLALYADDVVYWVPSWKSEDQLVSDVRREVSLIYHDSTVGLRERIHRIRTRRSVTAMPLPRTAHLIGNVLVDQFSDEVLAGTASWIVNEYDPRVCKAHQNFGRYEFQLRCVEGSWKIQRKKVILLNDLIPTVIDFYNL